MADTPHYRILTAFEQISFPEFHMHKIEAKVDTGAFSGAIHCTKVHEAQDVDGTWQLYFSPFDTPELVKKTAHYIKRNVRSSNGTTQERYFIDTIIEIKSRTYPMQISLADRSDMRWPVLIGRRFLRKHRFVVDLGRHTHVS